MEAAGSTFIRGEEGYPILRYLFKQWLDHDNANSIKYSTDSITDSHTEKGA